MAMTRRDHQRLADLIEAHPSILSEGVTLSTADYINLVRGRDAAEQKLMLLELENNV